MYTKKQRILAGFISAAFVFVIFFSLLFIVEETHHDCPGEGCPICALIHQAEQALNQIGSGDPGSTPASTVHFSLLMAPCCLFLLVPAVSLISQKVRMNN
ncbi:MAG: hypothetical protein ACOX4I_07400 [Anaerovoracaceae bacterium]|jgi:hypothetical protein